MNTKELVTIYNSFVLPYFLYCMPLWGGSIKGNNDILIKMQDKAIRILFDTKRSGDAWRHSNKLILPLKELYSIEILKFCYRHFTHNLPEYFERNVMPKYAKEIHNISTRHRDIHNYSLLKHHVTSLSYNSFTTQCIRIWNNMPESVKRYIDTDNISQPKFIKNLKDYILNVTYRDMQLNNINSWQTS